MLIDLNKELSADEQRVLSWVLENINEAQFTYEIQNPRTNLNLTNHPSKVINNFLNNTVLINLPNDKSVSVPFFHEMEYTREKVLRVKINPIWLTIFTVLKKA